MSVAREQVLRTIFFNNLPSLRSPEIPLCPWRFSSFSPLVVAFISTELQITCCFCSLSRSASYIALTGVIYLTDLNFLLDSKLHNVPMMYLTEIGNGVQVSLINFFMNDRGMCGLPGRWRSECALQIWSKCKNWTPAALKGTTCSSPRCLWSASSPK